MGKLVFIPVSLIAGLIGKRLFGVIWGVIDDEPPPKPDYRDVSIAKLVLALTIEGIIISVIRGMVSHGSRHAYARLTGSWPGDEGPESN
jgi:Protein of unknown function (DUF4235)